MQSLRICPGASSTSIWQGSLSSAGVRRDLRFELSTISLHRDVKLPPRRPWQLEEMEKLFGSSADAPFRTSETTGAGCSTWLARFVEWIVALLEPGEKVLPTAWQRSYCPRARGSRGAGGDGIPRDSASERSAKPAAFPLDHLRFCHHSDHGSQYTALAFSKRLEDAGILGSMGSVGDGLDNALAESFFATLQTELLDRYSWSTRQGLKTAIFEHIEVSTTAGERHSVLGYLSPVEFERRYALAQREHTSRESVA